MMENTGLQAVYDVNNNNRNYDGWGSNGSWFMWLIAIFAMMWGGGGFGGWGNNNGLNQVTNDFLYTNLNGRINDGFASVTNQNFDAQKGTWQQTQALQQQLCSNAMQQQQNTQDLLMQGTANGYIAQNNTKDLLMAMNDNRFASQQCCCETQKAIAAVQAENYRNTCEITTALHAEGEATRALITQNTMQELRDRLADRDRDLQTANFHLSQQAQNATLISQLRPFPQPAYITASPYQSVNGGCCGYTNGCA